MHKLAPVGIMVFVAGLFPAMPAAAVRVLTLDERVAALRAIRQVEWNETLWPEQNPGVRPSFEEMVPDSVIRREAEDALLESAALARFWARPVTGAEIQAEIDRMVRDSRRPAALRDRFAALDNDPLLIAECLARPRLVDRLARSWYARDGRIHGALRRRIESRLERTQGMGGLKSLGGAYRETDLREGTGAEVTLDVDGALLLPPEAWRRNVSRLAAAYGVGSGAGGATEKLALLPVGRISPLVEDDDRFVVQAILGRKPGHIRVAAVVWSKTPFESWWRDARRELEEDGGLENDAASADFTIPSIDAPTCTADMWTPARQEVPDRRYYHTAVWTGTEMIIWGGFNEVNNTDELNTGARYQPATDTWRTTSIGANAPAKRMRHTAVWTGSEMIVWGGSYNGGMLVNTGARYDPLTDSWSTLPMSSSIPAARDRHTAVWTGMEMIVWGGYGIYGSVNTGGLYCPVTGLWLGLPTTGAPSARYNHTAVWTGSVMIVWGGYNFGGLNTGGRFSPVDGTWVATSTGANAPSGREQHTAVWTGSEMIVWGGLQSATVLNTGGRYTPSTDTWTTTSTGPNVPVARNGHTAVWTGSQMIIWGGINWTYPRYSSGGRYTPSSDSWTATSDTNVPEARDGHTAVWTGREMIVWGGRGADMTNTGGRYVPDTDSWVPTSMGADVPSARFWHTAVSTGTWMIVWGGYDDLIELNTGGRYDLATDSWMPTSMGADVPGPRRNFAAVWSGAEMIVWGGWPGTSPALNTGGRYNPLTDTWAATTTADAPTGRNDHTAIWTGSEMIVWGGYPVAGLTNTGGRYAPASDTWTATSVGANVPTGRRYHTAVWSGQTMIIWGGETTLTLSTTNTGGRYDPASDTWLSTSIGTNVPGANSRHVAVWTGDEMVVWGAGVPNGGRYELSTDTWLPVTSAGAPGIRSHATAVWSGTEMIVWGGASHANTGGRYNPDTNSWIATCTGPGTPGGRTYHTAVWTGDGDGRMIVWGGEPVTQTGHLYCGTGCAPTTFYKDVDGDGYGGTLNTITGCTPPPGYVANATDCADADVNNFPGNAEVCDSWDNDCDFIIDTDAVIPAGVSSLETWNYGNAFEISWQVVPGADRYDIAKGWLSALRSTGGDFATALGGCTSNWMTRRIGDMQVPPEGDGFWYLVRAENCKGNGTWDEAEPGQTGSRDAELEASPNRCP